MAISAKDVMGLRQRTGMGMMECKAALNEAGGDLEAAIDILRKSAKGKMDDRTDRAAAEGVVSIAQADGKAAMVEINCETDFVARNDSFVETSQKLADHVLSMPNDDVANDQTITGIIDNVRITTKENVSLARAVKMDGGKIGTYVHHNRKVAALVSIDGDIDDESLAGLAQHISALDGQMLPIPLATDEQSLPAEDVAKARQEFIDEAKATGKPEDIAEKMASGKMRRWIEERTLLGQAYVKDMTGKTSVGELLKDAKIKDYVRFQVGVK